MFSKKTALFALIAGFVGSVQPSCPPPSCPTQATCNYLCASISTGAFLADPRANCTTNCFPVNDFVPVLACPGASITFNSNVFTNPACADAILANLSYQWYVTSNLGDAHCPPVATPPAAPWLLPTCPSTGASFCFQVPSEAGNCPPAKYAVTLVITDTCTGCVFATNAICIDVMPCVSLVPCKALCSQSNPTCGVATYQINVTNGSACNASPLSIVIQDCLPAGVNLVSVCPGQGWLVAVHNVASSGACACPSNQCIQALYAPALDGGATTTPIYVTVCGDTSTLSNTVCLTNADYKQYNSNPNICATVSPAGMVSKGKNRK